MIQSLKEAASGLTAKEEDKISKAAAAPSSSCWSRLKDPRIVRVSRAFGGKDRHSKVCTVRGLRDRRVRLSVPTAIQLYDLQDRLGFNQPSKVVDWLLNAAKNEIDELPPLPTIPNPNSSSSSVINWNSGPFLNNNNNNLSSSRLSRSSFWSSEADHVLTREKSKDVFVVAAAANDVVDDDNKGKEQWEKRNEEEEEAEGIKQCENWSTTTHSSLPGFLNGVIPYNSFLRWDPSNNLCLAHHHHHHHGRHGGGFSIQSEDFHHHLNVVPMLSSSTTTVSAAHPYFPLQQSHNAGSGNDHNSNNNNNLAEEFDPKQINFQIIPSAGHHHHHHDSKRFQFSRQL